MTTVTPAAELELRRALSVPLAGFEVRNSNSESNVVNIRGHAAVFDRLSHDLGGFRERIVRGAFSGVLDKNPDVHLVVGHDMTKPLARTANGTLELREDPMGLHMWARVALDTTHARDAVADMRNGLVDQASFAFTVGDDEWAHEPDAGVVRTIRQVAGLFDVSVVAQGAYPQTDSAVVRSLLAAAEAAGRLARGTDPDAAPIVVDVDPSAAPAAVDAHHDAAPAAVDVDLGLDEYRHRLARVRARLVPNL